MKFLTVEPDSRPHLSLVQSEETGPESDARHNHLPLLAQARGSNYLMYVRDVLDNQRHLTANVKQLGQVLKVSGSQDIRKVPVNK